MSLSAAQIKALHEIVDKVKDDPTVVHEPELAFFKDLVQSWGAKVPAAKEEKKAEEPKREEPKAAAPVVEEDPISDDEPLTLDEEDPDQLPEDTEAFPEKGPTGEIELSDEQMDKQGALKQEAVEALEDGNLQKAIEKYTEAIKIGNPSAMMYAKRAEICLKMKKPRACISDCDQAIVINPDSAKSFRIRGKAYRKLGNWEEAHKDLSTAQKLDFDDDTDDLHRFVQDRYKKIAERKNRIRIKEEAREKKRKEAEYKRRKAEQVEAQRRYEEQKQAEAEGAGAGGYPGGMGGGMGGFPGMGGGMPGGFPGGMGGGMGGMPGMPAGIDPSMLSGLMSDPELMKAFSNPKVMAAMQEIMQNPAAMAKYQDDPEISTLINKVMGQMGGAAAGGAGPSGSADSGPTVEEVDETTGVDEVD